MEGQGTVSTPNIEDLARKCGLLGTPQDDLLMRFAKELALQASATERAACAQVCRDRIKHISKMGELLKDAGAEMAAGMTIGHSLEVMHCIAVIEARGDAA